MKKMISACVLSVLVFVACNKKEPEGAASAVRIGAAAATEVVCGKEIITDQPVKVIGSDVVLPAKTRLCFTADNMEIRVELPAGFSFITKEGVVADKAAPVFATYSCSCSASGSACQVFYADGLGFGCLQSTCSGSCTGKFTYKGYSVDRVAYTDEKEKFFVLPEVQDAIGKVQVSEPYRDFSMYGVKFAVVNNEKAFLAAATCDCEGTQACKLKVINLPLLKGETQGKKIYYCSGTCNGCELTV